MTRNSVKVGNIREWFESFDDDSFKGVFVIVAVNRLKFTCDILINGVVVRGYGLGFVANHSRKLD